MKQLRFLQLVLLSFLVGVPVAHAGSVAVLPLLDVTKDSNGINLNLTDSIRQLAADRGYDVVPQRDTMAFLVRNRIRTMGALTSYEIDKLHKEIGADYALMGTVCQLESSPSSKISLSLQLVRTTDETVVWATVKDLHDDDLISLLGIADPDSTEELHQEYFSALLNDFPYVSAGEDSSTVPSVKLLTVEMRPTYVKPGEKIELIGRVYVTKPDSQLSLHLLVDGDIQPIEFDRETNFIKASWIARDANGSYPVALVSEMPGEETQTLNIGEYTVDAIPPVLSIYLLGKEVDGKVYFSSSLNIMTHFKVPEVTSMWEVSVFNEEGENILTQTHNGQLPQKIVWNGRDAIYEKVPDGPYRIVLKVWDRALHTAEAEASVIYRNEKPELDFNVTKNNDTVHVELNKKVDYPFAYWFAKIYRKDGSIVKTDVGEEIPPFIEFKVSDADADQSYKLIFAARDLYGNVIYQTVNDLMNQTKNENVFEAVPESQWLENF